MHGVPESGMLMVSASMKELFATEALKKVLEYLTEKEGITCVTAWCAAENAGSRRVLEKAGMQLVRTEKESLTVGDRVYERMIYEYRKKGSASGKGV